MIPIPAHSISPDGREALVAARTALFTAFQSLVEAAVRDPDLATIPDLAGNVQDMQRAIDQVLKPPDEEALTG